MRQVIIHLWFFAMCGSVALGQNLIPNPGFEDINRCILYSALCSPEGWRNGHGGKARVTDTSIYSEAYQGSNFSLIEIWNKHRGMGAREFLQVPLICPLKEGYEYRITLYVKPTFFAVSRLGIYFSDKERCEMAEGYDNPSKDSRWLIVNQPHVVFEDKQGLYSRERSGPKGGRKWLRLSKTFTARGTEKFMFIGNFQLKRELDLIQVTQRTTRGKSVYFIDEVSVEALDESALAGCCYEANRQAIYADDLRHSCPDHAAGYHKCDSAQQQITVGVPFTMSNINFKVDEAELLPEAYPELDSLARYLERYPDYQLKIHGHTDNMGGEGYNLELSQARADSVKSYLGNGGIDSARMEAEGYGFARPIATNQTPEGRRKNRRVEFYIE